MGAPHAPVGRSRIAAPTPGSRGCLDPANQLQWVTAQERPLACAIPRVDRQANFRPQKSAGSPPWDDILGEPLPRPKIWNGRRHTMTSSQIPIQGNYRRRSRPCYPRKNWHHSVFDDRSAPSRSTPEGNRSCATRVGLASTPCPPEIVQGPRSSKELRNQKEERHHVA